jgi:hypothetical protein
MIVAGLRAGYGLALLTAANPLLRLVTGRPATPQRRAVMRVLAMRELTQALVTAPRPNAACLILSAEVDLIHSFSMLGWAVIGNSRRLALTSGTAAACFAAGGVVNARRVSVGKRPEPTGGRLANLVEIRNRVAAFIAAYTLPRAARRWLRLTGADRRPINNGLPESLSARHQGAPN